MKNIFFKDFFLEQELKHPALKLNPKKVSKFCNDDIPKGSVFISSRIDSKNTKLRKKMKKYKFRFICNNIVFSLKKKNSSEEISFCKDAKNEDIKQILRISKNSINESRFDLDKKFPKKISKKMKIERIKNFFKGNRGDWMLIYKKKNKIYGFLLAIKKKRSLVIDLIATDEKFRKQGVATSLLNFAKTKIKINSQIIAGTQSSNGSAINFYKKNNFKINNRNMIFHYYKY